MSLEDIISYTPAGRAARGVRALGRGIKNLVKEEAVDKAKGTMKTKAVSTFREQYEKGQLEKTLSHKGDLEDSDKGLLGGVGAYFGEGYRRYRMLQDYSLERNEDFTMDDYPVVYNILRYGKKSDKKPVGSGKVLYYTGMPFFLIWASTDQFINPIKNMIFGKPEKYEQLNNPA